MRNTFAKAITSLAVENPRIVLLSGDIGNRLFDGFKEKAPDRFLNCGVAEANMIGVAAGMAICGLRPIAYTITSFIVTRCYEQIRLDLCYQRQPVVIVGVGSGMSYASLGATHHSCEDIAIMRALPNMTVLCPGDPMELNLCLKEAVRLDGPAYIRVGKKGEPAVHAIQPPFEIGKGIVICEGKDVCLFGTGVILPEVVKAADVLKSQGISATVVSLHTVKPLDHELLLQAFTSHKLVASIEEHSLVGGLGSALAEWCCDHQRPGLAPLVRLGAPDCFHSSLGTQENAWHMFGITANKLATALLDRLAKC